MGWQPDDVKTVFDSSNSEVSVDRPDNVVENDLILVFISGRRQTSITLPEGFTEIRYEGDLGNSFRPFVAAYYKVVTDDEPSSYTFEFGASSYDKRLTAGRVTGVNVATPIDQHNGWNSGSSTASSIDIPGITAEVQQSLLFAFASIRTSTSVTVDVGMTEIFKYESDDYATGGAATEGLAEAGETGDRTFSFGASDRRAGMMLNVVMIPFVEVASQSSAYTASTATLNGELTSVGEEDSVDVFFQYRKQGEAEWSETPKQTLTEPGTFDAEITLLDWNSLYEFRAVVEWETEGTQQEFGDTLTFKTDRLDGYAIERKIAEGDWERVQAIEDPEAETWDDDTMEFDEGVTYHYRLKRYFLFGLVQGEGEWQENSIVFGVPEPDVAFIRTKPGPSPFRTIPVASKFRTKPRRT